MSDLASLINIAPTSAAFQIGRNVSQARETEQLRQQELAELIRTRAMEAQRQQEMHPLDVEGKRLSLDMNRAKMPGIQAELEKTLLELDGLKRTRESTIEATNVGNAGKVREDRVKAQSQQEASIRQAATNLNGIPAAMRAGAFRAMLEQQGANLNDPMVKQMMQMLVQSPDQFPQWLMQQADYMGSLAQKASPTERTKLQMNTDDNVSRERVAAANRGAQYSREDRRFEQQQALLAMKLRAQREIEEYKANRTPKKAEEASIKYHEQALRTTDPVQREELMNLSQMWGQEALNLKNNKIGQPTLDVAGGGLKPQEAVPTGIKDPKKAGPIAGALKSGNKFEIVEEK